MGLAGMAAVAGGTTTGHSGRVGGSWTMTAAGAPWAAGCSTRRVRGGAIGRRGARLDRSMWPALARPRCGRRPSPRWARLAYDERRRAQQGGRSRRRRRRAPARRLAARGARSGRAGRTPPARMSRRASGCSAAASDAQYSSRFFGGEARTTAPPASPTTARTRTSIASWSKSGQSARTRARPPGARVGRGSGHDAER